MIFSTPTCTYTFFRTICSLCSSLLTLPWAAHLWGPTSLVWVEAVRTSRHTPLLSLRVLPLTVWWGIVTVNTYGVVLFVDLSSSESFVIHRGFLCCDNVSPSEWDLWWWELSFFWCMSLDRVGEEVLNRGLDWGHEGCIAFECGMWSESSVFEEGWSLVGDWLQSVGGECSAASVIVALHNPLLFFSVSSCCNRIMVDSRAFLSW